MRNLLLVLRRRNQILHLVRCRVEVARRIVTTRMVIMTEAASAVRSPCHLMTRTAMRQTNRLVLKLAHQQTETRDKREHVLVAALVAVNARLFIGTLVPLFFEVLLT